MDNKNNAITRFGSAKTFTAALFKNESFFSFATNLCYNDSVDLPVATIIIKCVGTLPNQMISCVGNSEYFLGTDRIYFITWM